MIEKRHIVLAALVVALGTAVYINWRFADKDPLQTTGTDVSTPNLGDAQYVNGSRMESGVSSLPEQINSGAEQESEANQYFSQAVLSRQKARDEAVELLEGIISAAESDEKAKQAAVEKAALIAQNIEQESKIENLLKAKGFEQNLAFIEEGKANILVKTEGLLPNETITIKDIVKNQSGIEFENIVIVEVK